MDSLDKNTVENAENHKDNLSPEDEEALFKEFPALRGLMARLDVEMNKDDYDVNDWRVWTWAYNYLSSWYPSRFLQILFIAVIYYIVRLSIRAVQARFTISQVVTTIVAAETVITPILGVFVPVLITLYLVQQHKGDVLFDGVTRLMVMFTLSSFALLPVAAICSTGNVGVAIYCGIFVRVAMMAMSLWYWGDLCFELLLSTSTVESLVRLWRWLVTVAIIIMGTAFRLATIFGMDLLKNKMRLNAETIRIGLGKTFPTALSLCNDPRGLFFCAALLMSLIFFYILYLFIFALNFGQIHHHRNCRSWLPQSLISMGVFLPDIHPDALLQRISASDKSSSYVPSRAMLLHHEDSVVEVDSSFLSTEASMPIFSYLEQEDEILAKEGASEWIKPRDEQLPVSKTLTAEKRSSGALLNWAQPLSPHEANMTFEEYFQTLQEDEYQYDPKSGNWIFDKESLGGIRADDGNRKGEIEETKRSSHEANSPPPDVPVDDSTKAEYATSTEFQPYLERFIEGSDENKDDSDGPQNIVFV